jgi:dipeptidyl aminopeptidase/acylaminoacyl peptidase
MKKTLLYAAVLLTAIVFSQCNQGNKTKLVPALIDRELFFGDPEISGAQLSPDGQYMSFIKVHKGTRNIWVKKTNEPFENAKVLTEDTLRPIRNYFWSRNGKYILYVQDKAGDENFNIYAVDPSSPPVQGKDVPETKDLTNLKGVRVYIYSVAYNDPNIIFIGLNDKDPAWHDVYKLDISTGIKTLIHKNSPKDRITGWIFDWNDKLRLATRSNTDGSSEILKIGENEFVSIYKTTVFETANPISFDKENKNLYLITNKGDDRNLTQLVLLDPDKLTETFIEKDPINKVDLNNVMISDLSRELIGTSYYDTKLRIYWNNKDFENDFELLQKKFPGFEINSFSITSDESLTLIGIRADTVPGNVYLFDRKTKNITFQYNPRPKLNPLDLATMNPVSYLSSDGMEINAYLTLPLGLEPKNLPVVILPHGGPWARDYWGFNSYHQFLANRGYAVLSPNFRGSTGYGKEFINAGNLQWGEKMQDDITWATKYLIDKGIADTKRIAIMGGSYGGYATLAGVTFTPDIYAAGVDIVGPSNLITLMNSIPPYWEGARQIFYFRMGNPTTPEGKMQLEKQSPLNSADKITTPLMVIQGANDPRVKQAEADQIVVALRDRGFPVEYILAPDEGHGFARPINNMAMMAAVEKFLAKYLNGRYQQDMKPELEKRLKEITVDVKTVELKK